MSPPRSQTHRVGNQRPSQGSTSPLAPIPPSMKNDALPCEDIDVLPREASIASLGRDWRNVECYARAIGIRGNLRRNFGCVLPGHEGCTRASFFGDDLTGHLKYACVRRDIFLTVAELEASIVTGEVVARPSPIERATWWASAWCRAGVLEAAELPTVAFTGTMRSDTRAVVDGFVRLLGLRWLLMPGEPVPYSVRFAARWCRLSLHHARRGITDALAGGAFHQASQHPSNNHRRPTPLYLPGPGRHLETWR